MPSLVQGRTKGQGRTMDTETSKIVEKTKLDPRFTRGQTLLKENRYEEAIAAFEDLLKTMVEVENQSDSLAVAPVYYEYGHAMLSLAEATASVFGAAAQEEGNEEGEKEGSKEHADDLEVAWEMIEVARVIYSRHEDDLAVQKELARVYTRLGDLGMESEMFEQARKDYETSLALRCKVLKATKDADTTLLADLYCCLAISCIYQDSSKSAANANPLETAPKPAADTPGVNLEELGLKYYVQAGRVMAANIHRAAKACSEKLQQFATDRVPEYADDDSAAPSGKGKQKASSDLELAFKTGAMHTLKDDFMACAHPDSKDKSAKELSKDDAQLLEYLDIYVELKEKVDGIKESLKHQAMEARLKQQQPATEGPVTTIGFGAPPAPAATSAPAAGAAVAPAGVNVIPVVKKRKITPQTTASAPTSS
ncbi:TPA: hypothetical protein N0F65_008762 [Lagenidium giganteum]|uniref:Tetratricopeptide SHNi-TPR domain-containing protein n=1 Tax=Lagenidium giganteum TaxID=4803 RepID=A0AAV2Z0W9_9STRA|nr:TPA: hypothetical protein N0F65_008762 [Lagenidium giganteum]